MTSFPGRLELASVESGLVSAVDFLRLDASRRLDPERRAAMGQFMTPPGVAEFMAGLFMLGQEDVRLLDPGAGVGSLTAAMVARLCSRPTPPMRLSACAFELDPILASYLAETLAACRAACRKGGVRFTSELAAEDFVAAAVSSLDAGLFQQRHLTFNAVVMNPPYKKISTTSQCRQLLRRIGIETSNLYTAFLALVVRVLDAGGELVAITPRSFCNGPYFRPFREDFLGRMTLKRIHIFEQRDRAFGDDDVLQENVIIHAIKGAPPNNATVVVSSSSGPDDDWISVREVPLRQVVRPDDPDRFIHIVPDAAGQDVADRLRRFNTTLSTLGIEVSTGRVVDFRAAPHLTPEPEPGTVPLIYPGHFKAGFVAWPKIPGRKPNAIAVVPETESLLVPRGTYALVKRFSSKEERRRVVAAIYDPARVPAERVGFENHLNVYHSAGAGLSPSVARGLAIFLNSTLVDAYFRQFNGHTQVNATDLRSLPYPTRVELERLGAGVDQKFPEQEEIDLLIERELPDMSARGRRSPVRAKKRTEEALTILKALGLPREQLQDRSALALLALLDLRPDTPWAEAERPLRGVTPIMAFIAEHYGRTYAPNSRETFRRQTLHQFLDAGLIIPNPDQPARAVNSPAWVYQIEESASLLLRSYGSPAWEGNVAAYVARMGTLRARYAREREMHRIPVSISHSEIINLSPGGQNELIKLVIEEFAARFAPAGEVLYVGDSDDKWGYANKPALATLGIALDEHGKMPDVVIHHRDKNWLLLVEAVTSHGPVSAKRRGELETLFEKTSLGLVYVTAFLTRKAMVKYLGDISWETEVWVAESPSHLIHFDGERFLGPYPGSPKSGKRRAT